MDEQRDSRIEETLACLNESPTGVEVKDTYQLEKLGNAASSKTAAIKQLRNGPCSPSISIGDTAKASDTSQAAFHNKPTLVRHLETRKGQL